MLARLLIIPSTVLCLLAIGYIVFTTGIHVRSYSMPSGSMSPTLVPGELILASGAFYASHTPVPGDIILFNVPREGVLTTFIKRAIAGPGSSATIATDPMTAAFHNSARSPRPRS